MPTVQNVRLYNPNTEPSNQDMNITIKWATKCPKYIS